MTLLGKVITVTSSESVEIASAADNPMDVLCSVASGTVYLGGSSAVTSTCALALSTAAIMGYPFTVHLWAGDELWAITAAATTLQVLVRTTGS